MGYLGFLFEQESSDEHDEVTYYILFVYAGKLQHNFVIGRRLMAPKEVHDQLLVGNDLSISPFSEHWHYLKFSMSQKTCIDYTSMLFWFAPAKYKTICQLLRLDEGENQEKILLQRLNELVPLFS